MVGLTERQRFLLDYIESSIRDIERPPTIREMASWMGVSSTYAVTCHLRALERKGYIERDDSIARGIRLVRGAARSDDAPIVPADWLDEQAHAEREKGNLYTAKRVAELAKGLRDGSWCQPLTDALRR